MSLHRSCTSQFFFFLFLRRENDLKIKQNESSKERLSSMTLLCDPDLHFYFVHHSYVTLPQYLYQSPTFVDYLQCNIARVLEARIATDPKKKNERHARPAPDILWAHGCSITENEPLKTTTRV
jgi:hypothetical protein